VERIKQLAAAIDALAADDEATYQRFELIRDEMQRLGTMAPTI
jgi:hypothetical protein